MFGIKRLVMRMQNRYDKKASKTLGEPIVASVMIKNLRLSRNPKEWLVLVSSSVVSSVIPVPQALDRLVDVVSEAVSDTAVDLLNEHERTAAYVDVRKRFRMGEDLYAAVTPSRFAILRVNVFTFNAGEPVLIVPYRAISECRFGDKLSFLRYPYNVKLTLTFQNGVSVWFGVHRWFRQRGEILREQLSHDHTRGEQGAELGALVARDKGAIV